MTLPVKKIFVDTKYMTSDSPSTSNFKMQLPRSIELPDHTSMFINNICIPHSWYTVEENFNDKLYIHIYSTSSSFSGVWYNICTLTPGIYNPTSLAAEIQQELKTATDTGSRTNIFTVVYNSLVNQITIAMNYSDLNFEILTTSQLKTKFNNHWLGADYDINNINDCNELISNLTPATYTNVFSFRGVVNLQPIRNIYIHSSLGSYQTIGPTPDATTCIKKVPVSADVGNYIFYDEFLFTDVLDCSKQTLSLLEFSLRDSKGNLINLHNNNISFSIGFVKQDSNY